jgi:hypothetical protein
MNPLILILLFVPFSASAVEPNVFIQEMHVVTDLIINISRLSGLILFGLGWWSITKNAENPQQHPLARSLWTMTAGASLCIGGVIYAMVATSVFGDVVIANNSALALNTQAFQNMTGTFNADVAGGVLEKIMPKATAGMVLSVVYLIGVISFIKGVYIVKDSGEMNQAGNMSHGMKAITHMFAGIIAMNFEKFGCLLDQSFGVGLFCPV